MRVLAITRNPNSASFEQRVLAYQEMLEASDVHVTVRVFPRAVKQQERLLRASADYDLVWWHRYLLTPPLQQRLRRYAPRIVYDFDDPVYYSTRPSGWSLTRRWRFSALLKRVDAAFPASHYLHELATKYCPQTWIVPMSIQSDIQPMRRTRPRDHIELLWLGSRSTQEYLDIIRPALEELGRERKDIRLRLVAHDEMQFGDLPVRFERWSAETQDTALAECDVGLCPMPDTRWTLGKCPYKILQYMASGIPWVGSAVGENLIAAGEDAAEARGLVATASQQWLQAIVSLADDAARRDAMGRNGIRYIADHHERSSVARQIADHFHQVLATPRNRARAGRR